MDAHAHLRGLGWRGTGFSLDSTDRGLAKPILVTHKFDSRGLGARSQKEKQADLWWLNAFDSALKNLENSEETALQQVQKNGYSRGGLYGFFVRGETLTSTLSDSESSTPVPETIDDKMARAPKNAVAKSKKRKAENAAISSAAKKAKIAKKQALLANVAQENGEGAPEEPTSTPSKKPKKEKKKRGIDAPLGIPNEDSEEVQKKKAAIVKEVKIEIRRRELAQEFGPKMPNPGLLLKMEKAADAAGPENFHSTELAKLSVRIHGEPEPGKPYKKVKYKAEKIKREGNIRKAKRDLLAQKFHIAFGTPYPGNGVSTKQSKAKAKGKSVPNEEVGIAETPVTAETIAEGQSPEPAKSSKKKEKKEKKRKRNEDNGSDLANGHAKETIDTSDATKLQEEAQTAEDNFATGADEIKVGVEVKRKAKKQKLSSLSSDTLKKEVTQLIEDQRNAVYQESAEKFFADTITQLVSGGEGEPGVTIAQTKVQSETQTTDLGDLTKDLTEKELKKANKAAAKKGLSLEEYLATKLTSKAKEQKETQTASAPTEDVVALVSETKINATNYEVGFIVDTEGDSNLVNQHKPKSPRQPKLSKAQRKKDKNKQKMVVRNQTVAAILNSGDRPREETTKDQVADARKKAKKILKNEKKKKRDKAIHRPKPGASLAGVYGGAS